MRASDYTPSIFPALLSLALWGGVASAQVFTVSVPFELKTAAGVAATGGHGESGKPGGPDAVVAWLTPLESSDLSTKRATLHTQMLVLTQKNKRFSPHLLVVPTGSTVEFPNLDPFFHNVFSLFNGRRFDLGLYEAGSRRSVRFDHEGISYIFCNIHPEMAAVVLSLSTPYYVVSNQTDRVLILNVPPGAYELNLWSEDVSPAELGVAKRTVQVQSKNVSLPKVTLRKSLMPFTPHLNKFGEEYKKPEQPLY